ncbi:uncharacterized protein V6R79_007897 [Siganus canaliculatus]
MMIGGLSALILLGTIYQTFAAPQRISTTVVELGGNLIFQCPVPETGSVFIWHMTPLGNMPQTVATLTYGQTSSRTNKRFTVEQVYNHYVLTIQNVNKDDEGTYLCQHGNSFSQTFTNGTFVAIKASSIILHHLYLLMPFSTYEFPNNDDDDDDDDDDEFPNS